MHPIRALAVMYFPTIHNPVCHGQWAANEKGKEHYLASCTQYYCPLDIALGGRHKVQWHTDKQNIICVIERGSTKPVLQSLVKTLSICVLKITLLLFPFGYPRSRTSWLITSPNFRHWWLGYKSRYFSVDQHSMGPFYGRQILNLV